MADYGAVGLPLWLVVPAIPVLVVGGLLYSAGKGIAGLFKRKDK